MLTMLAPGRFRCGAQARDMRKAPFKLAPMTASHLDSASVRGVSVEMPATNPALLTRALMVGLSAVMFAMAVST